MKIGRTIFIVVMVCILAACTIPLKMLPPPLLKLTNMKKHPYTVGLYIPKELKEYVYVVTTSLLDKVSYALGEQTYLILRKTSPMFLIML